MHSVMVVLLLVAGCSGEAVMKELTAQKVEEEKRLRLEVERSEALERRARDTKEKVLRLQRDLIATDTKVAEATEQVVASQTEADRASAMQKLDQLRREKAKLEARILAIRQKNRHQRQVPADCLSNPLAKDCD